MESQRIKKEQLNTAIKIVPLGILEVIDQQLAGAACVKP